jgi:uncharacterized cupin superfamily protein
MTKEARLVTKDVGLVPADDGWFVLNARDSRWVERDQRGFSAPLTGWTDEEAEGIHDMLGVNLTVLRPGEPMAVYHWENDQEAFLVVAGEALLIIEGEQRQLRQWDFVFCPVGCPHTIVGAGDGPCTIVAMSSRVHIGTDEWGGYAPDPAAAAHNADVPEPTNDAGQAYARWAPPKPAAYGGWLPGD